ncbi:MAG: hypothetical protein EPO20_13340 [Betaproteobacteria bacterium]|nr:MAG: hypothetical protein EPO20_13340 [Betaproteobacteria bacterium]
MRRKLILSICLALIAASAIAAPRQWGSWFSGEADSGDFLYAVTANDAGHLLGQYCFPDQNSCVYLLGTSAACEPGKQYPVLVDSDLGSAELLLLCSGQLESGHYRYLFTDFELIDDTVTRASKLAFVFLPVNDRFNVVLFDLVGSNEAIAAMRASAEAGMRGRIPTTQQTPDQRL